MERDERPVDAPKMDTSEQVQISSLALFKMLIHAKEGLPCDVLGLLLGEIVDDYTIRVVDVIAMPQSRIGVSVEAFDHVYRDAMLDMLKQTGRREMVVGWYRSLPSVGPIGCWLSIMDIETQRSFENLNKRAVAVVVNPIQSVKGNVVIDAFRLIDILTIERDEEPRQITSNMVHPKKISPKSIELQSKIHRKRFLHWENIVYYSISISCRMNELDQKMLMNLHKRKKKIDGLKLQRFDVLSKANEKTVQEMLQLVIKCDNAVQEENELPLEKLAIATVGRQDVKKHLEEHVSDLISSNIVQTLGVYLHTVMF